MTDNALLRQSQKEVERLSRNNQAFFDLLPEMFLVVDENCIIQKMNAAALRQFGNICGRNCREVVLGAETCACACQGGRPVAGRKCGEPSILKINDNFYVECTHIPLEGYKQEQLLLVKMRDVSDMQRHQMELEKYQKNLEQVLYDKITTLKESEKVCQQLNAEVGTLKKEVERLTTPDAMIGESKPVRELREMIYQVAGTGATILITGESGTGKELVADLVHKHSERATRPFLKFNCAAISESLLESDLFGYEKGAFTGAAASRKGKFEIANGGTIFLDEIGDISPKMQASLLRVLQNGEIIRVGGVAPIAIDVRVVAATNSDLVEAVSQGRFREDLFYRLNVINLKLVPLRARREDIVLLVTHFLKKYRSAFKKEVNFLPDKSIDKLLTYDWPGNIRELENTIQRAVLLCRNKTVLPTDIDIPTGEVKKAVQNDNGTFDINNHMLSRPLKDSLEEIEVKILHAALERYGGKAADVSEKLGMRKTVLYERFRKYRIDPKCFRKA
ncbi:sigma-54 interaction domain-containing protein [Thiovibrio sp. JS02]